MISRLPTFSSGCSLTFALSIALLSFLGEVAKAGELDKTGIQYGPYLEWQLENESYSGNPYDLLASVTFTHIDSGEAHTTEMFYDGGNIWKFRFTATRTGRWNCISVSADEDLDGKSGVVDVAVNSKELAHGFLKSFGNKWGWQGTEEAFVPQYVMMKGESETDILALHNNSNHVAVLIDEYMVDHGFTGFHLSVIGGRWFDITADTAVNSSMINPDRRTFEALEQFITAVHDAGGSVHIWAWGDDTRRQTPRRLAGGANGTEDQRLIRYIAARLGPLPGWSMGYGFDLDEWAVSPNLVTPWRDYFHSHSGWSHFLGGRPAGPNSSTNHAQFNSFNDPLDYSSYEHHRPDYGIYVAAASQLTGQPVFSEDRFRVRSRSKDYSEEETRRGLYHSTMAGGIANIWGQLEDENGIYANKEQLKTYGIFFNDYNRFTRAMVRANHLTTDDDTRILQEDNILVLYRENCNSVTVDLSGIGGSRSAVAVDTVQRYQEIDLGRLSSSSQEITLPRTSDWVIAIGDFPQGPELKPLAPNRLRIR